MVNKNETASSESVLNTFSSALVSQVDEGFNWEGKLPSSAYIAKIEESIAESVTSSDSEDSSEETTEEISSDSDS